MKKTIEEIWNKFQNELTENDKKVAKDEQKKTQIQLSKEFAEFIKNNNCKIKGGKKHA